MKTMAMPNRSAAAITSWSFTEPPGWMTAVAPAAATASSPSGNGKECIGSGDGAFERQHGFLCAEAGGIYAAHLACAHAHSLPVSCVYDGVGFNVLAHAPGKDAGCEVLLPWADAR